MKYVKTQFSFILLLISSVLSSCSDRVKTSENAWDEMKSNAKATYADAVELSKEKWNDLKSLSSDEWQDAGKSILELKDKVVSVGKESQPKLQQLLGELESLQLEAEEKLKDFGAASEDKVEVSKQALEKAWDQMQAKMEELRSELKGAH